MARSILPEDRMLPDVRDTISDRNAELIAEVESAIASNAIVILGMAQNPHVRKARKALEAKGAAFEYLQYGSYLGQWRRRNALKMWTGWPTFPMVFVKGQLVGGGSHLLKLIKNGALDKMIAG